jgi:hypothetical protein
MNRIFKLKFNFCDEDLEDHFISFSEEDQDDIEDLVAETFFDFHDDNDHYNCIMISTQSDVETYRDILNSNQVYFKIYDLSDGVINNKIDIESDYRRYINSENFMEWEFFINGINRWMLSELEIDNVLDRISEVGMDKLTKIEKYFLKNYNGKN